LGNEREETKKEGKGRRGDKMDRERGRGEREGEWRDPTKFREKLTPPPFTVASGSDN